MTGITGNLLSMMEKSYNIGVGASTAGFGIFAMYAFWIYENGASLGDRKNRRIAFYCILLFANVINSIQEENIDLRGHLGGFVAGLVFGTYYL